MSFTLALGIWFAPIPAGLTREAWHLFAVFAAAIFSVVVNAFPLLTASLLAVGAVVLTNTVDPVKAFAGFANSSVLLVIVAFLVAHAVVKSGLGRRISLLVVSAFGRSTLGLGYSIFLTDAPRLANLSTLRQTATVPANDSKGRGPVVGCTASPLVDLFLRTTPTWSEV